MRTDLIDLWHEVSRELGTRCSVSTTHDFKKLVSRFEHEGSSFLTITLPSYGSDLQRALDDGKVAPDLFSAFKRRGSLPLFLGGFMERVFDRGTGVLLDDPCVESIFAMRQLTLMFQKILMRTSQVRNRRAMQRFVEGEQEVRRSDKKITPDSYKEWKRVSVLLWADILTRVDGDVYDDRIVPNHGPGKTADRLSGNRKFDQTEWPERLERMFPYGVHALPNARFSYLADRVHFLEPGTERPVRVISVPKTLKTPRIIAIEPTCMQYMQQGIKDKIVEYIEHGYEECGKHYDFRFSSMIGFEDQIPNQEMARQGSLDGSLATLDLSDASDRVSNQLVRLLLSNHPHLREAVDSCRSRKADVLGHGVIRLAKFASMGSALTFPIEAMVFLTTVFVGIERELGTPLTRKDIISFLGKVRVYGDDIIVPVEYTQSVVATLEAFGFVVNTGKSYWNGKFRESCGKEYYDGHDVSVSRVRRVLPARRTEVPEMISLVSLRNQLYFAGCWTTAGWLDKRIKRLLGRYPTCSPTSPVLGRHTVTNWHSADKWCGDLHIPMVKGYVVKASLPRSIATGEGALLKCFLKRGDEPFADRKHLERQGRPDAVNIKLRWVATW